MKRENIIVIVDNDTGEVACYGSLKKACIEEELQYNTMVKKPFPISVGGLTIHKVKFN
jgi:hypothetical protein